MITVILALSSIAFKHLLYCWMPHYFIHEELHSDRMQAVFLKIMVEAHFLQAFLALF